MSKIAFTITLLLATGFGRHCGQAQLLSVDLNGAYRSDTTSPLFTRWDLIAGGTASQSFTNYTYNYDPDTGVVTTNANVISCTLAQVHPAVSPVVYLKADYANKDGNTTSPDPSQGWRLSMDGCRVHWKDDALPVDHPYTNGGAFSLTISNLSAGPHTITTHHNEYFAKPPLTAWHAGKVLSECIVALAGAPPGRPAVPRPSQRTRRTD